MKTENQKKIDEKVKDFKPQMASLKTSSPSSGGTSSGVGGGGNISREEELIKRLEERIEGLERRTYYLEELNEVFTSAPTFIPKTFNQQFVLYDTGGVRRLYVYVNSSWRFCVLT